MRFDSIEQALGIWAMLSSGKCQPQEQIIHEISSSPTDRMCIILRGLSGSGKSTFAQALADPRVSYDTVTCSADAYFMVGGIYNWHAERLADAHLECNNAFETALADERMHIVIDNTNLLPEHYETYVKRSHEAGYQVVVVEFVPRNECEYFKISKRSKITRSPYSMAGQMMKYVPEYRNKILWLVRVRVEGLRGCNVSEGCEMCDASSF